MAIQQKEVFINGETYLLTQLPGMTGLKLGKQLIKTLGPSFAQLQGEEASVAKALNILFDNLDDNAEALIIALVSSASKGSVAINFNNEFAGNYDTLFLLVKEIVEFNYGSVFQMLGSGVL
ncbi:hypothetical protein phiPsa267_076 [Pseudomonas phage phiPsa267]|uniref:Uncharacterized protein n=4 Tax=Otagovirus TaxID=2560197 RepID=A0A7G9V0Y8_9CAUD|nr:tail assembly chaperone [Pseudomonas phage phiPsa374]YP_010767165.1 hypothetical protein QGX16_gp150 [Pseudomonas phage phiPsa397]YP_010767335.1 hypothetical protein QGX17_gp152 [Pseudomonas phage phiPsa381]YP_010767686.1 hypothetical protein QGX19_gp154 [Pseudomonas phage phiPsa267]AHJ87330.1 hypothetical protein phiPsa374_071 [Pseudomonas phage phiPsa374]QNN99943.1 hypothetical protein phiPsa267_076 [Pseudomonas phage phiPsa267]QNO00632.1 hypothetical protein phiPsa381_072 [Pseudomonas p